MYKHSVIVPAINARLQPASTEKKKEGKEYLVTLSLRLSSLHRIRHFLVSNVPCDAGHLLSSALYSVFVNEAISNMLVHADFIIPAPPPTYSDHPP